MRLLQLDVPGLSTSRKDNVKARVIYFGVQDLEATQWVSSPLHASKSGNECVAQHVLDVARSLRKGSDLSVSIESCHGAQCPASATGRMWRVHSLTTLSADQFTETLFIHSAPRATTAALM